jgi:hypothetical protein
MAMRGVLKVPEVGVASSALIAADGCWHNPGSADDTPY